MKPISYARHRFPPDVIRHAVWLYLRLSSANEADKQPDAPPAEEPPKDNRDKFSRFDPSSGNQAQKTPKQPMGDSVPSKAAYELLRQRYEAKKFFARELAPWAHG